MDTSLLAISIGLATLVVLVLISQHRAETTKVLSQSEARLRSLVQNSSDIITILGADGTIRYESPSVERILGYKPEDLVGKSGFDYIHPEDASVVQVAFAKILQNPGLVIPVEYRFRRVNGAWVYLASVGNNCLGDRSVQGVVVNSRDISDRKQAESSLRFLVEASTVLTASLDYETTLANVARLAVPQFAEWCVVDIAGEEGGIRRLAVAHLDPAKVELAWELDQCYPDDPQGAEGVPKVLRTGEPQIYPEIPDALLVAVAQSAEHLKVLRELGCKSAIIMPLSARGRTLGALTFVISESGRRYGEADLSLASELARRAALAMDNARLYRDVQAREIQFRRIVESNIIGVIFWNVSGNITEANDAFLEMVGYTRTELLSGAVRWTDMTPGEYTQQDQRVLAELAVTGACNSFEKEYIRKDGTRVPVLLGATLMEGSQEQGVCFVLDITAQKRAEAALRQSEERYRAFIEQSSEGIWRFELEKPIAITGHSNQAPHVTGADCVALAEFSEGLPGHEAASNPLPSEDQQIQHFYQYGYLAECNDAMAQMYGLSSAEEIVGARLDEFLVRADPRNTEYLRAFIRSGYRLVDAESHEVDTQGNSRYFLNNLVGTVEQGVLVRAWGIQRDITVAKRLEAERKKADSALRSRAAELAHLTAALTQTNTALEKRNQELDQFAYVTSHDLKAPLRAIANLSQWLEEDLSEKLTPETQHQMHLLRGRVQRMEALIDGILQYSRAGRVEAVKPVAVEQLLGEVIDSLAPPPEFTIQVEPGMPTLVTERLLLEQVFANLISNAVKHHHFTQGKITLSAQDHPEFWEFAVADDGPGIPPQYHEKVFAIFQTLEARDTVESTGIGLAIVKKIVESKGGTIRLESQAEGTTFYFTWPKHPAQPTHRR